MRAKKFAEPVALSSTQPSDFGLPPTVLRFSFDLLALRARRKRQPIEVEGSHARPSAQKVFALCEIGKITTDELVAKSEDQLSSSEPARRFRNHSAPPTAAIPAATALLFGRCESSVRVADFAFCFATRFVAVHTAQPRRALRLFTSPMGRAYPTGIPFTRGRSGRRTLPFPRASMEPVAAAATAAAEGAGSAAAEAGPGAAAVAPEPEASAHAPAVAARAG